jgi:ribosomal protein S18 acetylase RimI-like enzyme
MSSATSTALSRHIIRAATAADAHRIVEITNDAFMADAFFKVPAAVLRFTLDEVRDMLESPSSEFLVAEFSASPASPLPQGLSGSSAAGASESAGVCGSLYFQWDVSENASVTTGKFSAVSVPSQFARRGIGQALVRAAEQRTLALARANGSARCALEMSVVNVRPDLFSWYGKQGFATVGPLLPSPPDFAALVAPEAGQVHLVLMRKELDML